MIDHPDGSDRVIPNRLVAYVQPTASTSFPITFRHVCSTESMPASWVPTADLESTINPCSDQSTAQNCQKIPSLAAKPANFGWSIHHIRRRESHAPWLIQMCFV